jgi:leucyl/phenylalanyl-tRNA--protein transferase
MEPNGLLAAGGSLSPKRLLTAYKLGIFPWFEETQPILWWSPAPRMVLKPSEAKCSKSLSKLIKKETYQCTFDQEFARVMSACAQNRDGQEGTWITESMQSAYLNLHNLGYAHSIEVWKDKELAGGLYGIAIGKFYFGESMFSSHSNASKVGFVFLANKLQEWGYQYIDCQVKSEHLTSLGAYEISRERFSELLKGCSLKPIDSAWKESK